ncbi:hypothetical protein M569_11091, partial [Genlisea aurea]
LSRFDAMSMNFSPSRSPGISRMHLGASTPSRLRSSNFKKPPEPLRRAVADCLSAAVPSTLEASRTLRDYLASHSSVDLTYVVILEHTLAERERSPAVVARCVALLKRYLLRYKPNEETLLQIDRFCISIITECEVSPYRKLALRPSSFSQQFGTSVHAVNGNPLTVLNFASGSLVKSLKYLRSLVSQYIPKRSFQPAAFAGAVPTSRQSLPSLSSLLSKSFNSQLNPSNGKESLESKDMSIPSVSDSPIAEEFEEHGVLESMPLDLFRWRWCADQQSSLLLPKGDHTLSIQDVRSHNLLEVGAAALLLGDMEVKTKGAAWKLFGSADMPYLDQLLQPSLLTTVTNSTAAFSHLRAITAIKRSKPGADQIWDESVLTTFRPRVRSLFQYRHYSEQQPLRLNAMEVSEVITAVCSETSSATYSHSTVSGFRHGGRPSMDVAVSVLVKLVIDMYVLDPHIAAPLTLSLLEDMLNSPSVTSKTRAFDLIINLGVHAHLLEPPTPEASTTMDEQYFHGSYFGTETGGAEHGHQESDSLEKSRYSSAVDKFECWILSILFEILLHLVQTEEKEETVWASSLSCLLYFVCDRGKIQRDKLVGLDIRVIKVLMQISRRNSWAEIVHCKLISMMTILFYEEPDKLAVPPDSLFLVSQVDLIGGINFIFGELLLSNSREERNN